MVPHRLPRELDEGFEATFERLRRWFRARGLRPEEAADLAQEVIARALVHLRRHGPDPDVGADPLLNTIGRNLLIDRARAMGPTVIPIEMAEFVDDDLDPSEQVARAAARRAVRVAIGTLSARHRRALLLSLDGATPAEIADHFGIQRNAADALLHRARLRLADQLRATVGATLGFAALIAMRVRAGARRASELVRYVDPAATGFAVNAAAAVVVVSLIGLAPTTAQAERAATIGTVEQIRADEASARTSPRVMTARTKVSSPTASDEVHVGERFRDPVSGGDHEAGARVWYEPGSDDGVAGRALHDAFEQLCAAGAALCRGSDG